MLFLYLIFFECGSVTPPEPYTPTLPCRYEQNECFDSGLTNPPLYKTKDYRLYRIPRTSSGRCWLFCRFIPACDSIYMNILEDQCFLYSDMLRYEIRDIAKCNRCWVNLYGNRLQNY